MEPVPNFSSKFCCLGANFSIFVSKSTPFVGYGPGSVTLTSPSHTQDISFDVTRCIICQVITDYKTTSTSNGYKRMREAGEIHNDQCRAYTHSCLGPTWVGTQSMCSYLHRYWCYCHSTIYITSLCSSSMVLNRWAGVGDSTRYVPLQCPVSAHGSSAQCNIACTAVLHGVTSQAKLAQRRQH